MSDENPDYDEDAERQIYDALTESTGINSPEEAKSALGRVVRAIEESKSIPEQETIIPEIIVPQEEPPWVLQQFFHDEIDLDDELSGRYQSMPVLSTVKFRALGSRKDRGVATLLTQDGSVQVTFIADQSSQVVQIGFTMGSMLTLNFTLRYLNNVDRARWIALMRREKGGLAFLWGPSRWENDYVICVSRKYFTNFFAFSRNNFEAAVRMTPEVTTNLIDWLDGFWGEDNDETGDAESDLLTW